MRFLSLYVFAVLFFLSGCASNQFKSDYFDFASNIEYKAEISPVPDYVDDGWIYYCRRGVYQDRQRVYFGVSGHSIISSAFGARSTRIIWESEKPENNYIAEIIVPEPDVELLETTIRNAVSETFNIQTEKVTLETESWILKQRDEDILFDESNGRRVRYSYNEGSISSKGTPIRIIGVALEGILKDKPVFTEINDSRRFDIELTWESGNFDDLITALNKHGLTLEKEIREVEYLKVVPKTSVDESET